MGGGVCVDDSAVVGGCDDFVVSGDYCTDGHIASRFCEFCLFDGLGHEEVL